MAYAISPELYISIPEPFEMGYLVSSYSLSNYAQKALFDSKILGTIKIKVFDAISNSYMSFPSIYARFTISFVSDSGRTLNVSFDRTYYVEDNQSLYDGNNSYLKRILDDDQRNAIINLFVKAKWVKYSVQAQSGYVNGNGVYNTTNFVIYHNSSAATVNCVPLTISNYYVGKVENELFVGEKFTFTSTSTINLASIVGQTVYSNIALNNLLANDTGCTYSYNEGENEIEVNLPLGDTYFVKTSDNGGEDVSSVKVKVSYTAKKPVLQLTPNYIGTSENPIIVPSAGTTFSTSEITAKAFVGETEYSVTNLTIDNSISYADAVASGGIYVTHPTATLTYTDGSGNSKTITLTTDLNIYVAPKEPVSIKIVGSDTSTYYLGVNNNKFTTPSGLTYSFIYNDNSEVAYDNETLKFKLSPSESAEELVSGTTVIPADTQVIYVECEIEGKTIYGYYSLNYSVNEITNLEITGVEEQILGNRLKKSDFTIVATRANGDTETLEPNAFNLTPDSDSVNDDGIQIAAFTELTVEPLNSTYSQTFDSTDIAALNITFTKPSINAVIIPNNLITTYNNGLESINFSNVKLTITYEDAIFTNEVSLDSSTDQTHFSVIAKYMYGGEEKTAFVSEDIDNYNGTHLLNITDLTSGSLEGYFEFSVENYFDSSEKEKIQKTFVAIALTEIKGIKIKDPYTDYRVGDSFLEKTGDDTSVVIYWEDNSVNYSRQIPLKSGYPALSIYPQQGTNFDQVDYSTKITVKSVMNANVSAEYNIKVLPRKINPNTAIYELKAIWQESVVCPDEKEIRPEKGVLVLYSSEVVLQDVNGVNYLTDNTAKVYGYIYDILDEDVQAKVVLFDDYVPELRNSANAEITFPSYEKGEADLINNCRFGVLFGANNSINRLFVSGNPKASNADWHTSELNLTDYDGYETMSINGNFSYFTSESVMYYGESDNKIVGYDIISDDKLLVLKDKSDKEKTVYFRTPLTLKAVDATGSVSEDQAGDSMSMEEFGLIKGNNSVAGVSPFTITNFNGDTLFVDADNQVSGLDLEGIVGDRQRYANSRSKYIDRALKDMDLSEATLWNNNKYLFLSIPNVGLYVTHFEMKSESQYEWWFVTSDNPKVFIEIDDKIYFGNDEGTFGVLENGTYKDIKKVFADEDQTSLVSFIPNREKVLLSNDVMAKLSPNKKYKFKIIPNENKYYNIYRKVANIGFKTIWELLTEGDVYLDYDTDTFYEATFEENKIYYLNCDERYINADRLIPVDSRTTLAEFGRPYRFKQVTIDDPEYDYEKTRYYMIDVITGERVTDFSLKEFGGGTICERLDGEFDVEELNFEENTFELYKDGKRIDIVTYGLQNPSDRVIKAEIYEYNDVEAFYISSPLFGNTLNTFKTVWQITLTNDTNIRSTLKVAIASNKVPYVDTKDIAHTSKGDMGISFNALSFERTDFDKLVVPRTYTINKVLGMQKFLCLAFKNEKGNNAVLSEMAITYTLPFPSYGSD